MRQLVVVCGAVMKDGKVLLTKRPEEKHLGGLWELPGGKIEPGENPRDALVRELKEEIAITVDVGEMIEATTHVYEEDKHIVLLGYWCTHVSGEVEHREVDDHKWLTADELDSFDVPAGDQEIISAVKKKMNMPVVN